MRNCNCRHFSKAMLTNSRPNRPHPYESQSIKNLAHNIFRTTLCFTPQYIEYVSIFAEKAQEMKAMAEQGLNAAKDKCKVQ